MLTGICLLVLAGMARPCIAVGEVAEAESNEPESQQAAPEIEQIVVTAGRTEQPLTEVPANVTIFTKEDINRSAAQTLDDLLRSIPGFSLFRRSSSLVAAPPTQGVSLRGVGPSAVSRTLVLLDGVPLNDPFGGWVYWSKVPTEKIERVEVVRGGGSSVWGNYAMAGVINIITTSPNAERARLYAEGGNNGTANLQAIASESIGKAGLLLDAAYFHTDGYHILADDRRGEIDTRVDSEHGSLGLRVDYPVTPGLTAHVRGQYFTEDRNAGTHLTSTATDSAYLRAGLVADEGGGNYWTLDFFLNDQTFESAFSSQAADRNSEQPALDQFDVPSTAVGAGFLWSRALAERHRVTSGLDYLWTEGETNEEYRFIDGEFTRRRRAGGEQALAGLFVQDLYTPSDRWHLSAAARVDYWRSSDGGRTEGDLETGETLLDDVFDSRDELIFSPKLGGVFDATDTLSVRASFYQGFRAPTINELYRPYRVRNDLNEPDEGLDPERLTGVDAGIDYLGATIDAKLGGYWNEVEDSVANVTVAPGPGVVEPCGFVPAGGVCRQKKNLDRTRIRGLEAEVTYRPHPDVSFRVSYLLSDTRIASARANPAIEGNRIPQVPQHQAVARAAYERPSGMIASVQVRYLGPQYEDDLNSRELGGYVVVDAAVSQRIGDNWEIFLRTENLFDREYAVAKTADGRVSLGGPVLVHAGVRLSIP